MACCGLALAASLSAQNFTLLQTNGSASAAGLVISGDALYGTTPGTVFKLQTNGTGYTVLHVFPSEANIRAGLVLSGNTLYGITRGGVGHTNGTIFSLNTDGTGFTNLHILARNEGAGARAGLLLSGNRLYGAGQAGGIFNRGTLFALNTDGTGFTNLHHFNSTDGEAPSGTLVQSDGVLYGTTYAAGASGAGNIFKINTDGTGFTVLHDFIGGSTTNAGGTPFAGLILSGSLLYGVTTYAGINDSGTIFRMNTDGSGFRHLRQFQGTNGAHSKASLLLRGSTLFGTTATGGSNDNGTVFCIQTDGSGFTNLHHFSGPPYPYGWTQNSDGANPYTDLILVGNRLYGTTQNGGSTGGGTVFSLSLPIPQLKIASSGTNVVLKWPANSPGFSLESSTSFDSPWSATMPVTLDPAPVSRPFVECLSGLATREVIEPDVFQHFFGPNADAA